MPEFGCAPPDFGCEMPSLLGTLKVRATPYCPEFQQRILMQECGCSASVLADMNAFLLERFGKRRVVLAVADGMIYMHPNTMEVLKAQFARREAQCRITI